jgi:hypothetical protein
MKMISVWMLSGSPSQCHMTEEHVMGIRRTMKRLARNETLQNRYEETILSRKHYKSAVVKILSVTSE